MEPDGDEVYGYFNPFVGEILINPKIKSEKQKIIVFIHELIHCLFYEYWKTIKPSSNEVEEKICYEWSEYIYSSLKGVLK